MQNESKNREIIQGIENEIKRNFFQKWFWDKPIEIYNHFVKHFWLYVTIISLLISLIFFQVLSANVGGWKNALYIIFGATSFTILLWLWKIDALGNVKRHLKKRWYWYLFGTGIISFALYVFEGAWIHSFLMVLREYTFIVFFLPVMFYSFKLLEKKETENWLEKVFVVFLGIIISGSIAIYLYLGGQQYIAQYLKYQEVKDKIIWLYSKPETVQERIYPRDVYRSVLDQLYGDNNVFSDPDLVFSNSGDLEFVSTSTPMKKAVKFLEGEIDTVIHMPASKPNLDYMIKEKVNFAVGEGLVWSRDIYNYVIKSLYWRYFNVFPTNVQVMKDDGGQEVMIVSLSQWKGWFFPTPEFYGVAIVKQGDIPWIKRAIVGGAKIIKKENFFQYKWLLRQNLNSEVSTRYTAESLRFENSFWAPSSFSHNNDVVVTDIEEDRNELPLVMAMKIKDKVKLYDFYELKPWRKKSGNARIYLWIPSDGQGPIYGYRPEGVVSIAELARKVRGFVDYNTEQKYVFAEPRPFFKKGLPETFVVSRVLKRKDGSFDPSGVKTYLINAHGTQNKVIEVPTYEKGKWLQIAKQAFVK